VSSAKPKQKETKEERRLRERGAWRNFIFSMLSLGVAFLLAVYSDVLAREGNVIGTGIAGSSALLLSAIVGVVWVPKLARRTSIEWLKASVDYHLTHAGLVYLGTIFVVAIAALNTGNNMLFLILAAMIAAILVSGIVSRIVLSGIQVEVILPEHVFAKQAVLGRVTLTNAKILLPTFSVLVGGPRQESSFNVPLLKTGVYFPFVKARRTASQTIDITFPKRGVYRQERLALSSRFPFGFLEKVRKVPAAREMEVYPSITPTEAFYEILPQLTGDQESWLRGRGHDLYSIRDYQHSDGARVVDWKASAHTGVLKVREFAREDERRVQIVFDRRMPAADPSPELLARFERIVEDCAALAWHFQETGAQLRFVSESMRTPFAPASEIVFDILDYLARVEPSAGPGGSGPNPAELGEDDEQAFRITLSVR
jgi:uncharacterized protein (DUF58 family)